MLAKNNIKLIYGGGKVGLMGFLAYATMVKEDFLKEVNREMILVSDKAEDLLDKMKGYQAPDVPKWIFQ